MALQHFGKYLVIEPICLGIIHIDNQSLQILNNFASSRICTCYFDISWQSPQGMISIDKQKASCHITEVSDQAISNAIGLKLASPIHIRENKFLEAGIMLEEEKEVQILVRFCFEKLDEENWFPLDIHQWFGVDPGQWQPTPRFDYEINPSIWARGNHALLNMCNGQNSDAILYRLRLEYQCGGEAQSIRFISWDLRFRCWWFVYEIPPKLRRSTRLQKHQTQ